MRQEERDFRTVEVLFRKLRRSRRRVFPQKKSQLGASKRQGVYLIYNKRGRVVHVGRTPRARGGIRQRLHDHLSDRSSFTTKYLKRKAYRLWKERFQYQYVVVSSRRRRALLEMYAIGRLCPAHLGLG